MFWRLIAVYCRFCGNKLTYEFIDLTNSPPSNSFLEFGQLIEPEIFYPLKLYLCEKCFLVQLDEFKKAEEIFSKDYIYYSSFSKSWLEHSKGYAEMILERFNINHESLVVEIASNDGYLLQYFKERDIPVLGIEPSKNTATVAINKGIETIIDFFDTNLAKNMAHAGRKADLIIGNNVLAHVPNLNDFVEGIKILLKPKGIVTLEFPHIVRLIENNQFDTIYHEHFSYFSLTTAKKVFKSHKLELFEVEEIPTHGGSLRVYLEHEEERSFKISKRVEDILMKEELLGVKELDYYSKFKKNIVKIKNDFLKFLIDSRLHGKKIIAYGAAAKGNTLLNYCGIKKDLIEFVVDASPHKQGKYLPGSHIHVVVEDRIREVKPDYVIILPWNIKDEIMTQLSYIREWGGKFVTAIPELEVLS